MNQEQTEEIEALEAIFMDDLVGTRACSRDMTPRRASPLRLALQVRQPG